MEHYSWKLVEHLLHKFGFYKIIIALVNTIDIIKIEERWSHVIRLVIRDCAKNKLVRSRSVVGRLVASLYINQLTGNDV